MKPDSFEDLWTRYKKLAGANRHNSVPYDKSCGSWTETELVKKGVSNGCGVYVIRAGSGNEIIYIGKAGTIGQNGDPRDQGIAGRLSNKAFTKKGGDKKKSVSRKQLFTYLINGEPANDPSVNDLIEQRYSNIEKGAWQEIQIEWIETYRDKKGIPPAAAEATLLWAYLEEFGELPKMNSEL